ncbi:30S ribosomal protein S11 [Candidatus Falkowbacteria bacterium CG10_big_fil_rev_8_21_14_0_10_43_11]|uniref:Small ribosomal subunit protein uS11 n=1 Tax=Candidatus Falkowbacteria bacterium CG10_big_fil_rev_8_21_14_0_10_43_11 TaxID=1974568 RepID=A0A2M6WMJ3_9BACT|nr:MAG: 30S ribosomal protein S11 [Candidatus Falkowbacteria bacterium CG10_big_fil_rev_8_21_14_0_10_43_11]
MTPKDKKQSKEESVESKENVNSTAELEAGQTAESGESKGEPKEKTAKKTKSTGKKKKKEKKNVFSGRAYINATYNNTIITLTDQAGDVLSWASAGACNFKGAKKATPYAAQMIVKKAVDKAKEFGLKEVLVFVKGVGTGRESSVRALNANGLNILSIKDITPIPHNGCRPRKPRRV